MFWTHIAEVALIGQIVLVVLAIRLFLRTRTRAFAFLMWACVAFVIAASSWFTFGFTHGFLFPHRDEAASLLVRDWQERTDMAFHLVFVILMILALLSFLRERRDSAAPNA